MDEDKIIERLCLLIFPEITKKKDVNLNILNDPELLDKVNSYLTDEEKSYLLEKGKYEPNYIINAFTKYINEIGIRSKMNIINKKPMDQRIQTKIDNFIQTLSMFCSKEEYEFLKTKDKDYLLKVVENSLSKYPL